MINHINYSNVKLLVTKFLITKNYSNIVQNIKSFNIIIY